MGEHENQNYDAIPRNSPEIQITLGKTAVRLTYENTILYTFYPPYEHVNHLAVSPKPDEKSIYIFESHGLIEQLKEFHYPEYKLAFPSVEDVNMYVNFHLGDLDGPEI